MMNGSYEFGFGMNRWLVWVEVVGDPGSMQGVDQIIVGWRCRLRYVCLVKKIKICRAQFLWRRKREM